MGPQASWAIFTAENELEKGTSIGSWDGMGNSKFKAPGARPFSPFLHAIFMGNSPGSSTSNKLSNRSSELDMSEARFSFAIRWPRQNASVLFEYSFPRPSAT
jgi:hypothetical protein